MENDKGQSLCWLLWWQRAAVAATMVGRVVRKEDEVLGSQKDIGESKIFLAKYKKDNDSYVIHQFVKALVINCKRCTSCK